MASQDKKMDQKIVDEVRNQPKMGDSQMMPSGHQNHSPGSVRQKRPYRLIPISNTAISRNSIDDGKISSNNPPGNQQDRFFGPPTNCSDLARLGYTLNGFHTVTVSSGLVDLNTINEAAKLETVYGQFKQPEGNYNSSPLEKRIAHSKVDSNKFNAGTGIHFYVSRTEYHKRLGYNKPMRQVIMFDKVFLNMGESFIEKSGWFIAPKTGVYQFICTTVMASIPKTLYPIVEIELILMDSITKDEESVGQSTTKEAGNSMVISATLKLKKGNKIYLITKQGGGYEIEWVSFSGSLLLEAK